MLGDSEFCRDALWPPWTCPCPFRILPPAILDCTLRRHCRVRGPDGAGPYRGFVDVKVNVKVGTDRRDVRVQKAARAVRSPSRKAWPPVTYPRPFWFLPPAGLRLRLAREFGDLGKTAPAWLELTGAAAVKAALHLLCRDGPTSCQSRCAAALRRTHRMRIEKCEISISRLGEVACRTEGRGVLFRTKAAYGFWLSRE